MQHPDSYAKAECSAKVKGCLMPNVKCPTFSKHAGSVYRGRADNDLLHTSPLKHSPTITLREFVHYVSRMIWFQFSWLDGSKVPVTTETHFWPHHWNSYDTIWHRNIKWDKMMKSWHLISKVSEVECTVPSKFSAKSATAQKLGLRVQDIGCDTSSSWREDLWGKWDWSEQ